MCGIAGILKLNDKIELKYQPQILSILHQRGPDGNGYACFEKAVLYHTRLSIIDLSNQSHQPFYINADTCLVFNGEIFNYKSLSEEFEMIKSNGDTEVLALYFNKYKIEGLNRLNGFFAFAYYDDLNKEMYVVRDRYGEKPLYYYMDENIFAFASDIRSLVEMIQKKLSVNYDALYTYFRLHYIAGEESILNGIKRLLPGHYIKVSSDKVFIKKWYDIESSNIDASWGSFKEIMITAVQTRLVSDAPIGALLSGGIDSSVVSAIAKQYKKDLHTFSLGYINEYLYNETADAQRVAKHIGSIHHHIEVETNEVSAIIPEFLNRIDEPFADSSAINIYFLSKKIKPYVTAVLSGDGADELLMGYNKHKVFIYPKWFYLFLMPLVPLISNLPQSRSHRVFNQIRKIHKLILAGRLNSLKRYIYLSQWATDAYIYQLFNQSVSAGYFYSLFEKYKDLNDLKLFNKADIEILLTNDMLYKTDFFGMQNAVEIRSPFLDHHVVEYLYHTQFKNKIYRGQQKFLLKKTFKDLLPDCIFNKKKKGFEIPMHKILPEVIENMGSMKKETIEEQRIFNFSTIEDLKQQMLYNNKNDAALKLWAVVVFQAWYNKFQNYIQ